MKKRNFALIPIVILIIFLFFYYIPFEFTHSLRENLGWILRQETEPIDILEGPKTVALFEDQRLHLGILEKIH